MTPSCIGSSKLGRPSAIPPEGKSRHCVSNHIEAPALDVTEEIMRATMPICSWPAKLKRAFIFLFAANALKSQRRSPA
jgi:hypothetical protein